MSNPELFLPVLGSCAIGLLALGLIFRRQIRHQIWQFQANRRINQLGNQVAKENKLPKRFDPGHRHH